eukprot:TRINITY_DN26086_c0_g1_i2.p1 TRINITY_DN26086_c0_g1~~TRINITY_DN26086_c0_g1_i2.p1  ORF type:complete len:325 (+),score=64.76 TRINITY_DN26086_c0_g1_i2:22-996(+)
MIYYYLNEHTHSNLIRKHCRYTFLAYKIALVMSQFVLLLITVLNYINCQGGLTQLPLGLNELGAVGPRSVSGASSSATNTVTSTESTTTQAAPAPAPVPIPAQAAPVSVPIPPATTTTATPTTPSTATTTTQITTTETVPAPVSDPKPASIVEVVASEAMVSEVSTEKQFVWQGATRVMVGACFDIQPPSGSDCASQKQLGKCSRKWMLEGGLCANTCGFCQDECIDIQPTLDYSCTQEKARNQCNRMESNFCRLTCGRCTAPATSVEEMAVTPISPRAEKQPTPVPTTPKAECTCEQCGDVQMQQILDAVEQAVVKVMQEVLQ